MDIDSLSHRAPLALRVALSRRAPRISRRARNMASEDVLYAVVDRAGDSDELTLVPYNDGLVQFARALVGHGGNEENASDVTINPAMRAREQYARAYMASQGHAPHVVDQFWTSVYMKQLYAYASGVSEPIRGESTAYEVKRNVIIDDDEFDGRIMRSVGAAVDWEVHTGYTLKNLVVDAATKGVGNYILLARVRRVT